MEYAAIDDSVHSITVPMYPRTWNRPPGTRFGVLSGEDCNWQNINGLYGPVWRRQPGATIPRMTPFVLEAVAGLIVAAIVATFGYASGKRAVQRKIDDGAIAFGMKLDDLLHKSVKDGEFAVLVNARAIVEQCQTLRDPLEGMRRQLNSEIDALIQLVEEGKRNNNRKDLFATLTALQASWPGKRRSMEMETRKLLALLGIE